MQYIYVKEFYGKYGITPLLWNIGDITPRDIIEMWKMHQYKDCFDLRQSSSKNDKRKLSCLLNDAELPSIIESFLGNLISRKS